MAYIINTAKHPLPNPFKPNEDQMDEHNEKVRRAHHQWSVPEKGIKALTKDERKAIDEFKKAQRLSVAPMWNGYEFHFTEHGKQGCLLEVEDNCANFLSNKFRDVIKVVNTDAEVPAGVTPIRKFGNSQKFQLGRIGIGDVMKESAETGAVRTKGVEAPRGGIITANGVVPA